MVPGVVYLCSIVNVDGFEVRGGGIAEDDAEDEPQFILTVPVKGLQNGTGITHPCDLSKGA